MTVDAVQEFSQEELLLIADAVHAYLPWLRENARILIALGDQEADDAFLTATLLEDRCRWLVAQARGEHEILAQLAEIEIPPDESVRVLNRRTRAEWQAVYDQRVEQLNRLRELLPEDNVVIRWSQALVSEAVAGLAWITSRELRLPEEEGGDRQDDEHDEERDERETDEK